MNPIDTCQRIDSFRIIHMLIAIDNECALCQRSHHCLFFIFLLRLLLVGYCATCPDDYGLHTVCAQITQEFLDFTRSRGNDLSTAHPPSFPGLKDGDKWCLCLSRWFEAYRVGKAPNICARATNSIGLHQDQMNILLSKAVDIVHD
jgi:uncharacterized protein